MFIVIFAQYKTLWCIYRTVETQTDDQADRRDETMGTLSASSMATSTPQNLGNIPIPRKLHILR